MSTPVRAVAFVLGLAVVFAAALGLGRVVGPLEVARAERHAGDAHGGAGGEPHSDLGGPAVGGLQTSESGYTLALADDRLPAGRQPLRFTVAGPDGHPLTSYDVQHEKRLHLVVVRRDLTGFQHLHPALDEANGEWSVDARLDPGAWRVLADFRPAGADALVLGADLLVPGRSGAAPVGPERRTSRIGDYEVALDGELVAGEESVLTLSVSRGGTPVTDLEPYLGAYGHLVALRAGDLGYLHVHPDGAPGTVPAGPAVVFHAEVPSAGAYRLFLDFRHAGEVRTADFTVLVDGGGHGH